MSNRTTASITITGINVVNSVETPAGALGIVAFISVEIAFGSK